MIRDASFPTHEVLIQELSFKFPHVFKIFRYENHISKLLGSKIREEGQGVRFGDSLETAFGHIGSQLEDDFNFSGLESYLAKLHDETTHFMVILKYPFLEIYILE